VRVEEQSSVEGVGTKGAIVATETDPRVGSTGTRDEGTTVTMGEGTRATVGEGTRATVGGGNTTATGGGEAGRGGTLPDEAASADGGEESTVGGTSRSTGGGEVAVVTGLVGGGWDGKPGSGTGRGTGTGLDTTTTTESGGWSPRGSAKVGDMLGVSVTKKNTSQPTN
jgi:hypothetical protein